jgi:tripartite-type tricarboxylate transporter receptor subunit TctC
MAAKNNVRDEEGMLGRSRTSRRILAAIAVTLLGAGAAVAQGYPQRPITLVVPSAAGNASDAVARILADKMAGPLGQRLVIENKVGAGGNIGTAAVAKAAPDGYTIGLPASGPLAVNKTLFANLPYDPEADFEPISLIALLPNVIVVSPKLPVSTFDEFVRYVKERPGQINYGSIGNGTSQHLAAAYFETVTGTQMKHVAYRGASQLVVDLISGDIHTSFQLIPNVAAQLQSGQLKPLAVTTARRTRALPDVPTTAELGLKDYEAYGWFALVAPKGTPAAIVERLHKEVLGAMSDGELRRKFIELGAEPVTSTPAELRAFISAEVAKWRKDIETAGIRAD